MDAAINVAESYKNADLPCALKKKLIQFQLNRTKKHLDKACKQLDQLDGDDLIEGIGLLCPAIEEAYNILVLHKAGLKSRRDSCQAFIDGLGC